MCVKLVTGEGGVDGGNWHRRATNSVFLQVSDLIGIGLTVRQVAGSPRIMYL